MVGNMRAKLVSNIETSVSLFEKENGIDPNCAVLIPDVCSLLENNGLFLGFRAGSSDAGILKHSNCHYMTAYKISDLPEKYRNRAIGRAEGIISPLILCYLGGIFRRKFNGISAYSLDTDPSILRNA
jgi:hypothetical protein